MRFWKKRALRALAAAALGVAALTATTGTAASAWWWDPHVRVWFNVSDCAGNPWGWYSTNRESGWISWNNGYQGYFDLYRVDSSGSVTTIKWGIPGRTCDVRYRNITRPGYGTTVALGWIG